MNIIDILDSDFLKVLIHEYYQYKIHEFYPDRIRRLFILCNSEKEKTEVLNRQIENCITSINELGYEELSYAYLLSCKKELGVNYISEDERYDFWLNRFAEEFEYLFPDINMETEIMNLVIRGIAKIDCDRQWSIDFFEFDGFDNNGKPEGLLFVLPELFVQLELLSMYRSFLEPVEILNHDPGMDIINPEVKIKSVVFDDLLSVLKDYFDEECQVELRELLLSGKKQNRKLVFNGRANQLTDVFKQLIENQMIVGCNKQYLGHWLGDNFLFNKKGIVSELNPQSTHKSISGKNHPCKKPIIQITNGIIYRF